MASNLKDAIDKTRKSTDPDSTRYALGGICYDCQAGDSFVSTDGRRISVVDVFPNKQFDEGFSSIISVESAAKVASICSMVPGETMVQAEFAETMARFQVGQYVILTRLIEGRFPAWGQLVTAPKASPDIVVNAAELRSAVRQAAVISEIESRALNFVVSDGTMTIFSKAKDIGESKVTIAGIKHETDYDFVLNSQFVLDFCGSISGDSEVKMDIYSSGNPLDITAVQMQEGSYRYRLAPMARE